MSEADGSNLDNETAPLTIKAHRLNEFYRRDSGKPFRVNENVLLDVAYNGAGAGGKDVIEHVVPAARASV